MASSQEMDLIISVGRTLMIDKRIVAGVSALWFYDYFLMLADEIEYAWPGKLSLIFVLFVLVLATMVLAMVIRRLCIGVPNSQDQCDKTAWLYSFYFTIATLLAQVVITLRIHAVTSQNRRITFYLSFVTLVQFGFGVYLSIRFATRPAALVPDLPFDEFQFCFFRRWRTGEIIYALHSVAYDTSAFFIVIYSARHRGLMRAHGVRSLLDTIVEDATVYFLLIFAGHLLVIFLEFLAPETLQLLPASGNAILAPLMITRLILSLKKAVNLPNSVQYSTDQLETVRFHQHTVGGTGHMRGGGIALRHLSLEGISDLPRSDYQI